MSLELSNKIITETESSDADRFFNMIQEAIAEAHAEGFESGVAAIEAEARIEAEEANANAYAAVHEAATGAWQIGYDEGVKAGIELAGLTDES